MSKHYEIEEGCSEGCCVTGLCAVCGALWPCDDYRQTKSYRIDHLENEVKLLRARCESLSKKMEGYYNLDGRLKAMEVYNRRLFGDGYTKGVKDTLRDEGYRM